jgi:hypothetical protein
MAVVCAAALLASGFAAAGSANAGTARYRLNPSHNIVAPANTESQTCVLHPYARPCQDIWIAALNRARRIMGQPRYALPGRFRSLAPRDQLLELSNLDRLLYGRTPIRGLNPRLNVSARIGVRDEEDPIAVPVNHHAFTAGSSNWFGGGGPGPRSPMQAYYLWMWDDGVGSNNIDCPSRGAPGCWGHRDDTLHAFPRGDQLEMGVGSGRDAVGQPGWTELYESFEVPATIPCLATVVGMSRHVVRTTGATITLYGFGFLNASRVTALGRPAQILRGRLFSLTIQVPAHRVERGYIAVYTPSGRSLLNAAAAFAYVS